MFKLQFLERQSQNLDEIELDTEDLSHLPLGQVSEMYFKWKTANNSPLTVARERRIFKSVLKFFGAQRKVSSIRLGGIRQYQEKRRSQVSSNLKKQISGRTVNYEMQLLRDVMVYADCWTDQLEVRYKPLRHIKGHVGKTADKEQLVKIMATAKGNDYWQLAMHCAAVAVGTGCRSGEIRNLRLQDINLEEGRIIIRGEIAKNRRHREPRLMALAEWGLRELLFRARVLGATEPQHYLLPFNVSKSRKLAKSTGAKWDVNRPMTTWVKSWRKLMDACGMNGFRFHDLRHTFRTLGAEAGVPLEVMMAQLGHMDRETSLDYVHIQQRALERAKQLIESEQREILSAAQEGVPQNTAEATGSFDRNRGRR
ncbi:MAG TPA: tyrosine-type recombinase/integrase [Candidatus Angelobacter sp.]|nr:tyrosine-type recombinase/integrase [Candidatus Angelobacter sp.]